jgi:hypothetical protein
LSELKIIASFVRMPLQNPLPVLFSEILGAEVRGIQLEQVQLLLVEDEWHSHAFGFLIWV